MEICTHCGQELQKASDERQIIKEELSDRQDKLDIASAEMLEIIQRIEKKIGADEQTLQDIKELEAKIRAKIAVEDRRDKLSNDTV